MKIGVIGTGYVGITLVCLIKFDHEIVLIGRNKEKTNLINSGVSPIHEPGLEKILKNGIKQKKIQATIDYNKIQDADVIFICVGTPSNIDGSINLSQIESCCKSIGELIKKTKKYQVIVVKSTVTPKTTETVVIPIIEKYSEKRAGKDFGVCMNPEFLREGAAVYDFMNPDKILIGTNDFKSSDILTKVYDGFNKKIPRVITSIVTAEMIKYTQNSMLASRISFMNEIANICEKIGVDVYEVANVIGMDPRVGPKFLNAGAGFGGACFPKDVKALINTAKKLEVETKMLNSIIEINEEQPFCLINLTKIAIGDLKGKNISVLGLAFKPNTDDMREARSIPVIKRLIQEGARVKVYDPEAMNNAKEILKDHGIEFTKSAKECLELTDACIIMTEWDEFRNLDLYKPNFPIIDGRRTIDPKKAEDLGIIYKGIGWKSNF